MILWKMQKSEMFLLNYIEPFSLKVSLCLQINGKQNTTFSFSVKVFVLTKSTKQHLN